MDKKNIYRNLFGPTISDRKYIPGAADRKNSPAGDLKTLQSKDTGSRS